MLALSELLCCAAIAVALTGNIEEMQGKVGSGPRSGFHILLTVHLNIFILILTSLMH